MKIFYLLIVIIYVDIHTGAALFKSVEFLGRYHLLHISSHFSHKTAQKPFSGCLIKKVNIIKHLKNNTGIYKNEKMNKIGPGIAKIQPETFAAAHLCLYGSSIYGAVILVTPNASSKGVHL